MEKIMPQEDIFIKEENTVNDALKILNKSGFGVLLVVDAEKKLLGTISDGDVRRHLLNGKTLGDVIRDIYNKTPIFIKEGDFSLDLVKKMLIEKAIEFLPIVDENSVVKNFVIWNQIFSEDELPSLNCGKIDLHVVIMAGGKGERLEPFTKIFPKPLIPVGDKPIIQKIIDEFKKQGVGKYYITLNHKAEMIESYFNNTERDYELEFLRENDFLGTVGSLKFLEDKLDDFFIVSNCDVIVKVNFEEVIDLHKKQGAVLTVLSSIRHHKIPYGVITSKEGGEIVNIDEKPEYTLLANTGIYILSKECLKFIPEKLSFDMTDLIASLIKNGKKVITYPVKERDYIDIGQWDMYKEATDKLRLLR